jgi:hypothetical protein
VAIAARQRLEGASAVVVTASETALRAGLDVNFFLQNGYGSFFVVIWQILSNHGLIRLKRFVSSISSKLYN